MTQPSFALPVAKYRNILVWPLLLRGHPPGDGLPVLARWSKVFRDNGWTANDPIQESEGGKRLWRVPAGNPYEEVVYFHPFVRDFLYGDGKTPPDDRSIIHHLRHTGAKGVRVTFTSFRFDPRQEQLTLRLTVDRVELYLCKPNVALFVVEVSNPVHATDPARPVTLGQVLDFQDQFRRFYPPFWYDAPDRGDDATNPGLCMTAVDWFADDPDAPLAAHDCTAPAGTFRRFTAAGAEPPVFAHWQHFFRPLRPLRTRHDLDDHTLCYQQIMDERIPALSYVGVDDPFQITDGDYDRITFFDAAGTDDFPYDRRFLAAHRAAHAYDRFAHYGTRFLFSGYGFSMVGKAGDYMFGTILEGHFRHHYFKLGLLAHYLRASLLGFAEELSEAVKKLRGVGDARDELANAAFRSEIEEIQNRFLKFRSRAWFPEVSNQQQGSELHRLWFAHLNIDALFKQVDDTSDQLHAILSEYETRQLSRSQEKLSKIAGVFLPMSIGLSLLSVLFASDVLPRWLKTTPELDNTGTFFTCLVLVILVAAVGGWLLARWKWK